MSLIWTSKAGAYRRVEYSSEADLESAVLDVRQSLFGPNRIYLDVKKRIGVKGGIRNIPDGYLIDLNGHKPRLYVVENELAAHEPLRHIAVQILQFSLSFESEPRTVRTILFNALQQDADAKAAFERYVAQRGFRGVDHLLDTLVFDTPFAALVIIDELPDELETVLAQKFRFGVEVLELARYQNPAGDRMYMFEPFLEDLSEAPPAAVAPNVPNAPSVDTEDLDTVVVPAREEGFQRTFIGENRWYSVRLHGTMRPQIKYVAAYRVKPISAITHIVPVRSIEPWKDSGKWVLNFSEPAAEISHVVLDKAGNVGAPQSLRYTSRERLLAAKTLGDIWQS